MTGRVCVQCVSVCGSVRAVCDARATRLAPPRRIEDEGTLLIYEIECSLVAMWPQRAAASGPSTQEPPTPKRKSVKSNSHSETHLERDIEQSRAIQSLPAATAQLCSPNTASATSATLVLLCVE